MRRATWRAVVSASALVIGAVAAAPTRAQAQTDVPDSVYVRQHYTKQVARIPMRDGARLFTTIYVPKDAGPGRRYPILLQRTPFSVAPYADTAYPATLGPDRYMLHDGYIFVAQDVRGRYMSEGTFENMRPLLSTELARDAKATDESTDAFDTIDWLLAHVTGNDGRVGLFGISYGGFFAAAAMLSRHQAIVATSLQAPMMDVFFDDFHHNGALTQAYFATYPIFGEPRPAPTSNHWWLPAYERVAALGADDDFAFQLGLGPLATVTRRFYAGNTWWRAFTAHPNYDAFWQARALPPHLVGLTHPVLVVGGWFDAENLSGTLAGYRALQARSPSADVSIVMGPFGHRDWTNGDIVHTRHGNLYFGDSLATRFQREVEAPFFRRHLKQETVTVPSGATMFDTGRKTWAHFARWPAPASRRRDFFLGQGGSLSAQPASPPSFVAFTSDPHRPVPTRCSGPTMEDGTLYSYMSDDQRCFAARADVAVFQTETLPEDITFAGGMVAKILLGTTGTDADLVVKLIDVYPPDEPQQPFQRDTSVRMSGYQQLVRGEIMRGRFRRSFSRPSPFIPNEPAEVAFTLPDVFHTFRKGHRIMVQVQGSWFPLFDRNPQRFVANIYEARDADFISAALRIHTGGANGSRLQATVLP
jgi:putative CocE/NonD family hydrolase